MYGQILSSSINHTATIVVMGDRSNGSTGDAMDLPEPDYDHLDLNLQAIDENSSSDSCCKASVGDDLKKGAKGGTQQPQYILGTLVIRVVACRGLEVRSRASNSTLFDRGSYIFLGWCILVRRC